MNSFRSLTIMAVCVVSLGALAGCNKSVSALETRSPPQPLPSVPLDPIEATELDPALAPGQSDGQFAEQIDRSDQSPISSGDRMASLDNGAPASGSTQQLAGSGGPSLTREALAGTWIVESDNPECRIILAFTKWSGGYRAATRRCESGELSAITAWDVEGGSVILVDGNGQRVASLYSAGPERYDGSTVGGSAISFTR